MQTGKIPSIIADSGATWHCGKVSNPFLDAWLLLTKIFHTPFGQTANATQTAKLI